MNKRYLLFHNYILTGYDTFEYPLNSEAPLFFDFYTGECEIEM